MTLKQELHMVCTYADAIRFPHARCIGGLSSVVMSYDNVGTVFALPASGACTARCIEIFGSFGQRPWSKQGIETTDIEENPPAKGHISTDDGSRVNKRPCRISQRCSGLIDRNWMIHGIMKDNSSANITHRRIVKSAPYAAQEITRWVAIIIGKR